MSRPIDFAAWLALGRVSNLPTVWTNLLAGLAVGGALIAPEPMRSGLADALLSAWGLIVGVSFLYIAGMVLNDVCDVAVDRTERPQRPLPSGRVKWNHAFAFVVVVGLAGVALIATGGWLPAALGIALAVTIIAYNTLHSATGWSVVLMGLCRGWVYVLGIVWVAGIESLAMHAWLLTAIMTAYTLMITVAARGEASDMPRWQRAGRAVAWVMLLVPAGVAWLFWQPPHANGLLLLALLLVVAWLARSLWLLSRTPPRIGPAVGGYLAGFCLIDGLVLLTLKSPIAAGLAVALFGLTLLAHRWVKGT